MGLQQHDGRTDARAKSSRPSQRTGRKRKYVDLTSDASVDGRRATSGVVKKPKRKVEIPNSKRKRKPVHTTDEFEDNEPHDALKKPKKAARKPDEEKRLRGYYCSRIIRPDT